MKTVKQLLEKKSFGQDHLSKMDTKRPAAYPSEKEIPPVIVLVRKAIRVFPDNQKIAMYYSQALDKYISIPYGPRNEALGMHLNESKKYDLSDVEKDDPELAKDPDVQDMFNRPKKKPIKLTTQQVRDKLPISKNLQTKGGRKHIRRGALRNYASGKMSGSDYLSTVLATGIMGIGQGVKKGYQKIRQKLPEETEVKTSFRNKLQHIREEKQVNEKALDYLDAGAEAIVPYYGAGKKALKGDWSGAAKDAATDTALLAAGGVVGKLGKSLYNAYKAKKAGKKMISGMSAAGKDASKGKLGKLSKTRKVRIKRKKRGSGAGSSAAGAAAGAAAGYAAGSGGDDKSAVDIAKEKGAKLAPKSDYEFGRKLANISGGTQSSQSGYETRMAYERPTSTVGRRQQAQESINLNKIKLIAENKNSSGDISVGDKSITINNRVAKKIMNVYESLNKENRKKVEKMLNEDVIEVKKLINFAIKA